MDTLLHGCLAAPILLLLASGIVPSRLANANPAICRWWATVLVASQLLVAFAVGLGRWMAGDAAPVTLAAWPGEPSVAFSIYYDGPASLMLTLVSFIGLVIARYSYRQLDGEANQGRYFRWLAFTVGAVSLMVVSGNLLLFFAAWVLTSLGLHQLLLHYPERPAAQRAAWTKFAISRLGDAFLIVALVLVFRTFGTFELTEIFAKVGAASGEDAQASIAAIAWLVMLGAITKSAQFPFHGWLPDTLETPTPVSALMHAGIVNAGGYLVIRMSPLLSEAPAALWTLAGIGAVTSCFAAVVMLTQPSIKRALAYSTIAQMGFMMLQCGLGAFSAAMLHILAHSLYKAYAFLGSGSVVTEAAARETRDAPAAGYWLSAVGIAAATTFAIYATLVSLIGLNLADKSGGFVLAAILCIALASWSWRLLAAKSRSLNAVAVIGIGVLSAVYILSYLAVDAVVASSVGAVSASALTLPLYAAIALAFLLLFALHIALEKGGAPEWLDALHVHAANGFYVEAVYRRAFSVVEES